MVQNAEGETCCDPADAEISCCKVEALVSVDERGQMVLPKELREKANIRAGDKLAVISHRAAGKVCCISLLRAEDFTDTVKNMLGPMMQDIFR